MDCWWRHHAAKKRPQHRIGPMWQKISCQHRGGDQLCLLGGPAYRCQKKAPSCVWHFVAKKGAFQVSRWLAIECLLACFGSMMFWVHVTFSETIACFFFPSFAHTSFFETICPLIKGFCHRTAAGLHKMVCFTLSDVVFHDWSIAWPFGIQIKGKLKFFKYPQTMLSPSNSLPSRISASQTIHPSITTQVFLAWIKKCVCSPYNFGKHVKIEVPPLIKPKPFFLGTGRSFIPGSRGRIES